MLITLTPIRHDGRLTLVREGDTLIVNGQRLELAAIPEGAILPQDAVDCPWIASDIRRRGGRIELALLLPHGPDAPPQTRNPAPVLVPADGPVPLPPWSATEGAES